MTLYVLMARAKGEENLTFLQQDTRSSYSWQKARQWSLAAQQLSKIIAVLLEVFKGPIADDLQCLQARDHNLKLHRLDVHSARQVQLIPHGPQLGPQLSLRLLPELPELPVCLRLLRADIKPLFCGLAVALIDFSSLGR